MSLTQPRHRRRRPPGRTPMEGRKTERVRRFSKAIGKLIQVNTHAYCLQESKKRRTYHWTNESDSKLASERILLSLPLFSLIWSWECMCGWGSILELAETISPPLLSASSPFFSCFGGARLYLYARALPLSWPAPRVLPLFLPACLPF